MELIKIERLIALKKVLNISEIARLSEMESHHLALKINYEAPLQPDERIRITQIFKLLGIEIEVYDANKN